MKKIIYFPTNIDLSRGSKAYQLLRSGSFSKLRSGLHDDLTATEIHQLRTMFGGFTALTEDDVEVTYYVGEDEELSLEMMRAAAHELTKLEMKN